MTDFQGTAGVLAQTLRRLRSERSLSLNLAAERVGISRRLLVGLEQGAGNPSLSTLLRLADGYGVGLADLVDPPETRTIGVRLESDARTLWSTAAGSIARLLIASAELELWAWEMVPGDVRQSDPHRPGTQEILRLQRGQLTLQIGDTRQDIVAGQAAIFTSDRPHRIKATGRTKAQFLLVVHEPR